MAIRKAGVVHASILQSLPPQPLALEAISQIVKTTIESSQERLKSSEWENAIRADLFQFVMAKRTCRSSDDSKAYLGELYNRLDVTLACQEEGLLDSSTPLGLIEDLFEMHRVDQCQDIFDWVESRSPILLKGLQPSKGKALVLLRALNALARRVSKTGTSAQFNGRILNYLSGVFPIGERSALNLQGDYGPKWDWEPLPIPQKLQSPAQRSSDESKSDRMEDVKPTTSTSTDHTTAPKSESSPAAILDTKIPLPPSSDPTSSLSPEEQKIEFYNTFWSLQYPFSFPQIFHKTKCLPDDLKRNVDKVLAALGEATKRDRQSSGNKSLVAVSAGVKRKREDEGEPFGESGTTSSTTDYFFAKFLTRPDLLDLQIADLHFRRQILVQLAIFFYHLNSYLPEEKEKSSSVKRALNMNMSMDFTLDESDAKWVKDAMIKVTEELRASTGQVIHKTFQDTVINLMEREKTWVRWKNENCTTFAKSPISHEEAESARLKRQKFVEPVPDLVHVAGTEDLTEVWEGGYQSSDDLDPYVKHKAFDRYVRDLNQLDKRIEMKQKQLDMFAQRNAASKLAEPKEEPPPASAPVVISGTSNKPIVNGPIHGLPPKPGTFPHPSTPNS
ncbi:THO complex subunit 1 transcription elongation factor-domain-containing protein, partial [Cantharellus anzutake]|uniref:THO complex subunit 1 transcription elongation factor-domain-containing protein n=1 Tax=Cantharellus anzutake TaxID=1750568 RepID=UPI0019030540